jgi:large subunit ribosomal protein L27
MKLFKLNLQQFASKKGVGSTTNGRDSAGRRLGAKASDGQTVTAGSVIYRQRGTRIYPGINTKKGGDDTIFATKTGIVKYQRWGKDRTKVSVLEATAK